MKKLFFLLIISIFLLFGCTQIEDNTITFESGINEIGIILTGFNENLSSEDYENYSVKLIEFKTKLNEQEETEDIKMLKIYADYYIANSNLFKISSETDPNLIESFYLATSDGIDETILCESGIDIKELDNYLEKTAVQNKIFIESSDKILQKPEYLEKAGLSVEDIEISKENLSNPYILVYLREDNLIERMCGVLSDLYSADETYTALSEDLEICNKLDELDSTESQIINALNNFIELLGAISITQSEYELGNNDDVEAYSAQFEILKETLSEGTQEIRNLCLQDA